MTPTYNLAFPNEPYFRDLAHLTRRLSSTHRIIVDHRVGTSATLAQLFSAILACRAMLAQKMGVSALDCIRQGKECFVATLLPPGYDFIVAPLAALSLGAGLVPLSAAVMPEEAL